MTRSQIGVAFGMLCALALTLGLVWWITADTPGLVLPVDQITLGQRLWFAVMSWVGPLAVLTACIGAVANTRFFSREDIDGAGLMVESPRIQVRRAVLTNTHEQLTLALPVYTGLALTLPVDRLALPLILSAAFVIGRILFALGYRAGATARSFGFALTMYPTVAGLGVLIWRLASVVKR
jgi:hypothetical protein